MRTRLAAGLSAAALAAALGGPAGLVAATGARTGAVATPVLTVAIPGPFGGCDPGSAATTPATDAVLSLVLPSAFVPGPLDAPAGDTYVISQAEPVATSPQTVQYTIAPGATWPDGAPLTAGDLVRTWHERRGDGVLADLGYRDVASVRAVPAGTGVVVRFRTPYADWESLFNLIVPRATSGARCALPSAALDPSIGPYEVVAATRSAIELRANPRWPGTAPAYARVVVTTDPAAAPPAPSRDVARLTYLPSPTLAELQAITSPGGYASRVQHDTTVVSLDFAVSGADALAPWARDAVAKLVDRATVVADVAAPVDDTAAPVTSHLFGQGEAQYVGPTGTAVSAPATPTSPAPGATGAAAYGEWGDPASAAAALRAHGYAVRAGSWRDAAGAPLRVCLAVPATATLASAGAAVAELLRAKGVDVVVDRVATVDDATASLAAGACGAGIVSRTSDGFVSHAVTSWLDSARYAVRDVAWTGVDDPVVAADAAAASRVLDPQLAATTWDQMDTRLWDLMAGLPLFSPSVFVGWSPSVAGELPTDTLGGFVEQIPTLLPSSAKP